MDTKLVVVVVVAFSIGVCQAAPNLFDLKYMNIVSLAKLQRHLTDKFAPNATDVARLLAWSRDKNSVPYNRLQINQLLKLAEFDFRYPLSNCAGYKFKAYNEIIDRVSANTNLRDFAQFCHDWQYEQCKKMARLGDDRLFKYRVERMRYHDELVKFAEGIAIYIVGDGEETDPEEKSVANYLRTIDASQRQEFRRACAELDEVIRQDLHLFDEEAPKHWEPALEENSLLQTRCQIVSWIVKQ